MTDCQFCQSKKPIETAYSQERDPDLPWGYWLRHSEEPRSMVVDRDGSRWSSVREAFWIGRMGMGDEPVRPGERPQFLGGSTRLQDEQSDMLLSILLTSAGKVARAAPELTNDVLGYNRGMARHYMMWLQSRGLVVEHTHYQGRWALTDEGWAVLLMLKATRPEDASGPGSGREELAGGPDMADVANPAVDVSGARFVFERGALGGRPVITMIDRDGKRGRMPMQKTVWSCAFTTAVERDRLFAWMCARSDRWQDWGDTGGGDALTQHLLDIYVSSIDWREPQVAPQLALTHAA